MKTAKLGTARLKNIFRTLKGSLNRFLAISSIVALGAGFLGGLQATSPDMKANADAYMDKYNWFDIDVDNELGFTDSQIEKIQNTAGIKNILQACVTDDVFTDSQLKRHTARVFGFLPENPSDLAMNQFEIVKGHYPQADDECLVQVISVYSSSAPEIGDTLFVSEENAQSFSSKTVKVAGIVKSPMYFSAELEPSLKGSGFLELACYVKPEFFALGTVNHVYALVDGASSLDTWSDSYKNLVASVKNDIDSELGNEVNSQIDSLLSLANQLPQMSEKARNADSLLQIAANQDLSKHSEVAKILNQSETGTLLASLLSNENTLVENSTRTPVAYSFDADQIHNLEEKVQKYKNKIYSVNDRNQNAGYAGYKDNIEKISSLSKVFPVFFFFIALLVSLTTMTRLIEEKRTELGTLKSLGFSSSSLLLQYLFYAFLFSLLGCAVGLAIGFKIFPAAVNFSYGMLYKIPGNYFPFRWDIAIPVSAIAIGVILIATAAACVSETLANPAALNAPKAPKAGKRILLEKIGFIWKKMSFSWKVTARNMFLYKRRLWMTIIGISGCSALLVAGFGLRDSLQDIISIQFTQLDTYNLTVLLDGEEAFSEDTIIRNFLEDKNTVTDYIKVSSESAVMEKNGKSIAVTYYVPENPSKTSGFVNLRTRKGHHKITLDEEGIVINEKQGELLGIKPGDSLSITINGISKEVKVLALAENYLYANIYSNAAVYEKITGTAPEFNSIICHLNPDADSEDTVSKLMESPSVTYAMQIDSLLDNAHRTISSINIIVIVIIITSGILSFIVLYNLSNINICERKREIATLLVLGYTEKEARQYIFREINVLSLIGIVAGLFLGGPLHSLVVHATEVNIVMWGRTVHPLSYLFAFAMSVIFTVFVNIIMRKSITDINMVESLKTKD